MFNIGDRILYSYVHILPSGTKLNKSLQGCIPGFCPDNEDMVCVDLDIANGILSYKVNFKTLTQIK